MLEVWHRSSASDEVFHQLIEFGGSNAGLNVRLNEPERVAHYLACFAHARLLVTVFYRDH